MDIGRGTEERKYVQISQNTINDYAGMFFIYLIFNLVKLNFRIIPNEFLYG